MRVSEEGRAPKNDPALFALAMAAGLGDEATRRAALEALPRVARTGTHLFQFAAFVEQLPRLGPRAAPRGRRLVRGAAGRTRSPTRRSSTASATASPTATCCAWRTRQARCRPGNPTLEVSPTSTRRLFEWIVRGGDADGLPRIVEGFARAQAADTPKRAAELVREYRPAARGVQPGAPHLARGVGGAAGATCR